VEPIWLWSTRNDLGDALGALDARARAGNADWLAEPLLERR
jgi:hypothetical protein